MKIIIINKYFSLLLFISVIMASCSSPVLKIEHVPANTPRGSALYLAGDFNRWDPGDRRFSVQLTSDSVYFMKLPNGFGKLHCKFTRGDWTTVETDLCGFDISNRLVKYFEQDTITISIESWKDLEAINCPEVTIVVNKMPQVTPEDATIAIAGNFNEWNPDEGSRMQRDSLTGKYVLKLPRKSADRLIEFKITRGNLMNAEADKFGKEIAKRRFLYGEVDTLFIDIENWEDLQDSSQEFLTIILGKVPVETFPDDQIFLTGSFNGWYPKDSDYLFYKNSQGKPQIRIPKPAEPIEFKITRGDWSKQEADKYGYIAENRRYEPQQQDTVILSLEQWIDRSKKRSHLFTIVLGKIPANTPADASVYISGAFNSWNPGNRHYIFEKKPDGKYYYTFENRSSRFEFKITRGSWRNEEADMYGNAMPNRTNEGAVGDTLVIEIKNWVDLPPGKQERVVLFVTSVPPSTPKDKHIFVAGTFNNWNPANSDYILSKNLKGQYYITIPRKASEIGFKFTLGSWDYEEQDAEKTNIPNRYYKFGYSDTLFLKIENWKNL